MALGKERYRVTVADGQTSGYTAIPTQALIRLFVVLAPALAAATYTLRLRLPGAGTNTVVFEKAALVQSVWSVVSPEAQSGANKFTDGVPVFSRHDEPDWELEITTSAAVSGAKEFTVDLLTA